MSSTSSNSTFVEDILPGYLICDVSDFDQAGLAIYAIQFDSEHFKMLTWEGNHVELKISSFTEVVGRAMLNTPKRAYMIYKSEHLELQKE